MRVLFASRRTKRVRRKSERLDRLWNISLGCVGVVNAPNESTCDPFDSLKQQRKVGLVFDFSSQPILYLEFLNSLPLLLNKPCNPHSIKSSS